jgi:hypothetical protein
MTDAPRPRRRGEPPPVPVTGQPWERYPGESTDAYAAFLMYRDMGRGERSLSKVARKLTERSPHRRYGGTLRLVKGWSTRWAWTFRADQWDVHLERMLAEELRVRLGQIAEQHATIANAALAAASKALNNLIRWLDDTEHVPHFAAVIQGVTAVVELRTQLARAQQEMLARTGVGGVPLELHDVRAELERRLAAIVERRREVEAMLAREARTP